MTTLQPRDKTEHNKNINIEKYLRDITVEFLAQLQKHPSDSKQIFIDILIKFFNDIITHPYIDKYRIMDANYQPDPITLKKTFCINFFKRIGFIEEMNGKYPILFYPYSAPIPPLVTVQAALKELGKGTPEYTDKAEITQITDFGTFLKLQSIIDKDLLNKEEKAARVALNMNLDELRLVFAEHQTRTLLEILLVYYREPKSITKTLMEIISTKRRAEIVLCKFLCFQGLDNKS